MQMNQSIEVLHSRTISETHCLHHTIMCTISCNNKYIYIYIYFRPRQQGPLVLPSFVAFLQASLAKMAGLRYIPREFIDYDFWAKMPLKFSAIQHYDKSLVSKIELLSFFKEIFAFFRLIFAGRAGSRRKKKAL